METPEFNLIPRLDSLSAMLATALQRKTMDEQLAPVWAEQLRHFYTKVLETKYPEMQAVSGSILPIDTSVKPASTSWQYYVTDQAGYADWIDDDGNVTASGTVSAKRFTGTLHEMGHGYDMSMFDLERASEAGLQLAALKLQGAKRYHDAFTNWVWQFGDSGKELLGLFTHPNIPTVTASTGGSGVHFSVKTNDEIAADLASAIDIIAEDTIGQQYGVKVFFPRAMAHYMRNQRLGAGDGFASLWDWMKDRYKGDDSGQPSVSFHILNECSAATRRDPRTGTDTSGITGDFVFVVGNTSKDEAAFIRARPFTQHAPQERDFVLHHLTNSKIGGTKMQLPLAFRRLDYGVSP